MDSPVRKVERLLNPDEKLIAHFWRSLPSPIEMDYEDFDAARRFLKELYDILGEVHFE